MRVLVAGVGNVLKGDDGFGVHAARAAADDARRPAGATVIDTGIGGIHLVQELMRGYDALVLFDACDRGASAGRLFLLAPDLPDVAGFTDRERRDFFADMHYATPVRALTLAREVGALPGLVRIVAAQIADADTFGAGLAPEVAAAVAPAVTLAFEVISALAGPEPAR
ncbi:hydrogenase maturation protease [Rhodobacteraceae bacterium 2CG4]|uniref:Hydrogenase maturation protease n=1 Tax=Halovulum marinum TaxID=2662447 RepID=A0A6L5Z3S9_9RHOB|nr:hydrogenase maturation protease [Halovulum marinum]MSU91251.1 hydrogenase maturation protease [Halovulum marinum]